MSGAARDLTTIDAADFPVSYDETQGTYHAWCDADDYEPASTGVVRAVASVHGVDPLEIEPLGDRVDTDALNGLVAQWSRDDYRPGDESITFSFARCTVTVRGDGEIVIDPDSTTEHVA